MLEHSVWSVRTWIIGGSIHIPSTSIIGLLDYVIKLTTKTSWQVENTLKYGVTDRGGVLCL